MYRGLIKRVSALNNYFIKAPIAQCCYVILRVASNDVKVTKPFARCGRSKFRFNFCV